MLMTTKLSPRKYRMSPAAGYTTRLAETKAVSGIGENAGHTTSAPAASGESVSAEQMPPERPYVFPPADLLTKAANKAGDSRQHLQETAMKLQQTLKNFGVNVTITNISCGPAVTRYELQPEMGVKVSKIVNLADDIKLNLAAADIRIEAPIPGKAAIGIEVPNKENVMVSFRELVESEEFKKHPSKISFGVGKDIGGKVTVADIAKMPHLLIAGATGSGKSVCINTIIMSILYKANPKDNDVLKQYIMEGYAINEKRMFALQKTVNIQTKMLAYSLDLEEMCIRHWKKKLQIYFIL